MAKIVIIGGGLAGLAAAATAARAGAQVHLIEAGPNLGGRAQTQVRDGFALNLGPHALYAGGAGMRVLTALGVRVEGAAPPNAGTFGIAGGRLHPLPADAASLLATGLLSPADKIAFATRGLSLVDARIGERWGEALRRVRMSERGRRVVAALARVSTYMNDPEACAVATREQMALATTKGVLYLHDGWGRLVEGLVDVARAKGARLETNARALRIADHAAGVRVEMDGRDALDADAVIIATPPPVAAELTPALAGRAAKTRPVRVAHLDLCMSSLPMASRTFALGIDDPVYFSVHSAVARVAPEGRTLAHAAVYLAPGAEADRAAVEAAVELVQPGWRAVVETSRFLAASPVAYDTPRAATGGLAGRQPVQFGARLFAAGDWVGAEGLLADAALASGAKAGAEAARAAA